MIVPRRPHIASAVMVIAAATSSAGAADGTPYKHLGVASCASSQCHGKREAQTDRNVALNEYRIWYSQDRHAQAFRTLAQQPLSRTIAGKLGLANPATAGVCLDCHADNVPQQNRGAKFRLNDGVGCEACHGGAERWIQTHAQKSATHTANLAAGMYRTDSPTRRAQLCLSCHLGTPDKFATHALIAAGHPRLRFELHAFTANQPPHFLVDADYVARKGKPDETALWFAGQIEGAQRYLALAQSRLFTPGRLLPEFAFYDCFACHHATDKIRWTPERAGPGVPPGTLRLQKQYLVILEAATAALGDAAAAGYLHKAGNELTRAGQADEKALRASAHEVSVWLQSRADLGARQFSRAETAAIRRALVHYAATDRGSDYCVAEQVFYGAESLSYPLQDRDAHRADLDALYNALSTPPSFDPGQFARAAALVEKRF